MPHDEILSWRSYEPTPYCLPGYMRHHSNHHLGFAYQIESRIIPNSYNPVKWSLPSKPMHLKAR